LYFLTKIALWEYGEILHNHARVEAFPWPLIRASRCNRENVVSVGHAYELVIWRLDVDIEEEEVSADAGVSIRLEDLTSRAWNWRNYRR